MLVAAGMVGLIFACQLAVTISRVWSCSSLMARTPQNIMHTMLSAWPSSKKSEYWF